MLLCRCLGCPSRRLWRRISQRCHPNDQALALRQGALSSELRAAMSFAQLLRDQDLSADTKAVLQPVYDHFTEGFDTADLKAAKALLEHSAVPRTSASAIATARVQATHP